MSSVANANADHNTDTHAITVTRDDPEGTVPPPPVQEEGEEPVVHVQAVAALAKICGSEDLEDLGEGEQTATELLEDLLAHDPSCVSPTSTLLLFRTSFSAMYALPHYSTFLSRLKPLLPYSLGRAMLI
jgi:hypothetical protein